MGKITAVHALMIIVTDEWWWRPSEFPSKGKVPRISWVARRKQWMVNHRPDCCLSDEGNYQDDDAPDADDHGGQNKQHGILIFDPPDGGEEQRKDGDPGVSVVTLS